MNEWKDIDENEKLNKKKLVKALVKTRNDLYGYGINEMGNFTNAWLIKILDGKFDAEV